MKCLGNITHSVLYCSIWLTLLKTSTFQITLCLTKKYIPKCSTTNQLNLNKMQYN